MYVMAAIMSMLLAVITGAFAGAAVNENRLVSTGAFIAVAICALIMFGVFLQEAVIKQREIDNG